MLVARNVEVRAGARLLLEHASFQVAPGDTLWGIASEIATDGDVRSMMSEIERLNALESAGLQAGQKLRVPVTTE